MKKFSACVIALFVVMAAFSGSVAMAQETELDIYVFFPDGARQVYASLAEHSVVKELMKMTGYKMTFMHPPVGDDGTFFNTTIASGEYPDLFQSDFKGYPGGPEGAMDDGVLIDATDLIKEYAPNFMARINAAPEAVRKKAFSDSGKIIRFGTIFQCELLEGNVHQGVFIRKDLLNKLGLAVPTTIDEFVAMLRAFKADGVEVPLAMPKYGDGMWQQTNVLAGAFDVPQLGFFLQDGKVAYGPMQPGYRDYMAFLKLLVDEQLLDPDFPGKSLNDSRKLFMASRAGVALMGNWHTRQALELGQMDNADFDVAAMPRLKRHADDPKRGLSDLMESVNNRAWFISSTAKDPIAAVKLIDLLHDEEVNRMLAWGLGNEEFPTYVEVDGKRTFTDFMQNNPDFDYPTARDRYTLNPFQTRWDQEMELQQYNIPANHEAWDVWTTSADNRFRIPSSVNPTADESREAAQLLNSINTYTEEMFYKFVFGQEPLDNFDAYVAQIEKMDIARATELQQAAYERYLAR